jgi:hypothetical protein
MLKRENVLCLIATLRMEVFLQLLARCSFNAEPSQVGFRILKIEFAGLRF